MLMQPVDLITQWPIAALTPSALLAIAVLLLFTGKLRPVQQVREQLDAERAQRELWHTAYELERKSRESNAEQTALLARSTEALASQGELSISMLRELRGQAGLRDRDGDLL